MARKPATYCVVCLCVLSGGGVWAQQPIEGICKASEDKTLSFVRSGRVAKVHVREGQAVEPGMLLVSLDDRAERIQLEFLKAKAADTTSIQASKAKYEQAKLDYDKMLEADRKNVATPIEVEHAKLNMQIAKLTLDLSQFEQQQNVRKMREFDATLRRMEIRSDIQGRVERVFLREGESADALQKVIRVVKTDPLWVEVLVPIPRAKRLRVVPPQGHVEPASDQVAEVRIGNPKAPLLQGEIIHKASVAEAGTNGLIVRLKVPNPDHLPAGQRVWVMFPVEKNLPGLAQEPPKIDLPEIPEIDAP
jgi:RND family efflux transporter MFP subunit